MSRIYQLKITLKEVKPPIWRRVLVPGDITLDRLHIVLQIVMGWTNTHLHQFAVGRTFYTTPGEFDDDFDDSLDGREYRLEQIAPKKGSKFLYEYDFGDGWAHAIVVEAITEPEKGKFYPQCTAGKRGCPPEDCGGPWGYEELLEIMKDRNHPDHKERTYGLGEELLDPEFFDMEEANEILKGEFSPNEKLRLVH